MHKSDHLPKLNSKLENLKLYWSVINKYFQIKNITILLADFFEVQQYLILRKKLNFLTITLRHNVIR